MKFSIRENYGNWYGYAGGRRVRMFFNDLHGTQEENARKWLASNGTCPDCGHAMDVDPACTILVPVIDAETFQFAHRATLGKAALCGTCETCIEL